MKHTAAVLGMLCSLLMVSNNAFAQASANGLPCDDKAYPTPQCASGYCSKRLGKGKVADTYLCMAKEANCPIPGGWGVMYTGEYNFGGKHWYCSTNVGIEPDGPARDPEFISGSKKCSGFWEKIDCNGDWFNEVFPVVRTVCLSSARDGKSAAFCAAAEITAREYGRQMK